MNYTPLYSKMAEVGRAQGAVGAPPATDDMISFAGGLPDPGSFPTDDLASVTASVLRAHSASALQYGPSQGEPRLRQYLADRLNEQEGLALTPDQIVITSGSLQGITLIAQSLVDPGDTILLEGPTFLGTIRMFRLFRPRLEELPLDDDGLIVGELERRLQRLEAEGVRPKFFYSLPTFQNPTGVTMPLERRLQLLDVARKHSLLIVEDDPYGDLRYEGSDLPSLLALDRDGLVVRLGTFSKILAAGLRLGWAAGPAEITRSLTTVKLDGGTNPYASHLAAEWASSGALDPHIRALRDIYRERRDAMLRALERHCAAYCRWTKPAGGFFIWVELNDDVDPDRLLQAAREAGVAYLPGTMCFASGRGERNLRLAFSLQTPDTIEEGIRRLGSALHASSRFRVASSEFSRKPSG
jgi:2-aminoadipate transaminase